MYGIFCFLFFLRQIDKHANTRCYENTKKINEKLGEILDRHEKLCMIKQKILRDLKYGNCAD